MNKVYEIITDRIIEKLEQGCIPWKMPWSADCPKNLISDKDYRGINPFLLESQGFVSPYWLTYKQAQGLGGCVTKGEKGCPVVFWKTYNKMEKSEKTGMLEEKGRFVLRYYTVFNIEQCTLPAEEIPQDNPVQHHFDPIPGCERIVKNMPQAPEITHITARACYSPELDIVNMPTRELFENPHNYYSTLFHELTHATGHQSRLDRKGITDPVNFGSHLYSKEELIAEMGAAFLSGKSGIDTFTLDNSASYIDHWIKRLKGDPTLIVAAAGKAQRASDFILGTKFDS